MKQAIVIASTPQTSEALTNLIDSLKGYNKYPIIVLIDNTFELGKINYIYHSTDIDEFLLLHDSCEIKDLSLFDIVFEEHRGESVALSDCPCIFGCYLGKYRREVLAKMFIPLPKNKSEAVQYEVEFNKMYIDNEPNFTLLFNDLRDRQVFEEKFGRLNMKLENKYLIKYKGTWSPAMIKN